MLITIVDEIIFSCVKYNNIINYYVIIPMVYCQVDFWILDRMVHLDCCLRYKDHRHNIQPEYTVTVFPCFQNIYVRIAECYKRHAFCNHVSTFGDHFRDDQKSYTNSPKRKITIDFSDFFYDS